MSHQASESSSPPQQQPQQQQPYHVRAVAAMASDHGRKVHELPWLYLDSVGQEYGPVPGWTMREWLTLGRFPVGRDLRVRLPEWESHLPLHQLFPDLGTAFVLPPAWPNIYVDAVLQGEEPNPRAALAAARGSSSGSGGAPQPAPELEGGREAGEPEGQAASGSGAAADGRAAGGSGSGSSHGGNSDGNGRWVPLPQLWMAGMKNQQRPPTSQQPQQGPQGPQQPLAQDRHMGQEQPMLPPPPPQPSEQQLRELLSQPQEGPLLWEDNRSFQFAAQLVGPPPFICTGPYSANDAIRPVSF